MRKITINVHSFIDIITNSSTEIYVQATEQTVKNLIALIDSVLAIGGSKLKCDDVFLITLNSEDEDEDDDYYDEGTRVFLEAKPLIDTEHAKIASTILCKLQDLFEAVEVAN